MIYKPEGSLFRTSENQKYISSMEGLADAMANGVILEARVAVCDSSHNLIIDLPCGKGIIPRTEGAIGIDDGSTRDIALISRVNKIVCFKVIAVDGDNITLSRKSVQEECMKNYIDNLVSGQIIDARITHLEQFGCFVDIGCGIPSLIPIDAISVSRISHPSDRFRNGDFIHAVVKYREGDRIFLTHKELLGTWEQNAELFEAGETVSGIVRSVEDYGIFVELTPNLAGLAEPRDDIKTGQSVSVYVKAIIPEKMKVKLIIVDTCEDLPTVNPIQYYQDSGIINHWCYSTDSSPKKIISEF
ncbi:MAG: S1 RNA-binding domain-containing protein [Ruminococcus sp.]|nr:S1 RNA-binding domain-containing protein [Ruminococcus sp.]